MQIVKATLQQIPDILKIYENARNFMIANGNTTQWQNGYPSRDDVQKDIENKNCYLCMEKDGRIAGVFAWILGEDPTYQTIYQGDWHRKEPYGTIHRIASAGITKGIAEVCFDYCLKSCSYLRIDTHRDNHPMQKAILSYGFSECGIIHIRDGSERIAYDLIDPNSSYDQAIYERAHTFAKEKHEGQKRIGGEVYITHPEAVAEFLRKQGYNKKYQVVGLFHDLLEDTDATPEEIREIAGEEVLEAVQVLTKKKGYVMQEYVQGILENEIAYAVKGADRLHNLQTAHCTSRKFREKYIKETKEWYLDFLPEISEEVKRLEESLEDKRIEK